MINCHYLKSSNPQIPESEWNKPVYFKASQERPDSSWGDASNSTCAYIGFVPSLFIGVHAGWTISGVSYPLNNFRQTHFGGSFTGGRPIGLDFNKQNVIQETSLNLGSNLI